MKSATEILDAHLCKMVYANPSEYLSFEEMKDNPEYRVCVSAMEEYAEQFKPPPIPADLAAFIEGRAKEYADDKQQTVKDVYAFSKEALTSVVRKIVYGPQIKCKQEIKEIQTFLLLTELENLYLIGQTNLA